MNRSARSFARRSCTWLLLAAVTPEAQAAVGWWSSQGPPGGEVADLAVLAGPQPSLLAATNGGVFRSTDGGEQWVGTSQGIGNSWITVVAGDPDDASRAYAATYSTSGLLYRSTDAGETWSASSLGFRFSIFAFAVAPSSPSRLYAGGLAGLARSSDHGQTCTDLSAGLGGEGVRRIAVDPRAADTLWVITEEQIRLLRSQDAGVTWTEQSPSSVRTLTFDPDVPSVLYAGCGEGILRSEDAGLTWSPWALAGHAVDAISIDPADPQRIVAGSVDGLFRTGNGGLTWQLTGPRGVQRLVVRQGTFWAAGTHGVLRSGDGGVT